MRKAINLLNLVSFTISLNVAAQLPPMSCDTKSNNGATTFSTNCGATIDYAPVSGYEDQVPVKTVKINIHYILKNDGSGNFTNTDDGLGYTDYTGYDYAKDLVKQLNFHQSINEPMNLPNGNTTPNPSIQIRYKLMGVYFDSTSTYYNYPGWNSLPQIKSIHGVNLSTELNIFYLNSPGSSGQGHSGASRGSAVFVYSPWENYKAQGASGVNNTWSIAPITAHELGHSLGLRHTIQDCCKYFSSALNSCPSSYDDGCNDTPSAPDLVNIYGNTNPCGYDGANDSTKSNNLMDYNNSQRAVTPCQLGKIHARLSNVLLPYVLDDYCDYNPNSIVEIKSGQAFTWKDKKFFNTDIVVRSGGKLTIQCEVAMAKGASFVVEPGGELIVDGGEVTNICGDLWEGIQVHGDPTKSQIPLNSGNQGLLVLKNGAVIENAHEAVRLYNPNNAFNSTGGIVRADDAVFRNNWRSVAFLTYQNFFPGTGSPIPNRSYFNDCTFEWTKQVLNDGRNPYSHVTMFEVDGINFTGCTFQHTNPYPSSEVYKNGRGIISIEAAYRVGSRCASNSLPCAVNDSSIFKNLYYGIDANNVLGINTITLDKVVFTDNLRGALLRNTDYATIKGCRFDVPQKGNVIPGSPGIPSGTNGFESYGLYLEACSGYKIESNKFTSWDDANNSKDGSGRYGSIVTSSGNRANRINNNTYNYLTYSSVAAGANSNGIIGLQTLCNDFLESSGCDIGVSSGHIARNQGSCSGNPAGNKFSYNSKDILANPPISPQFSVWSFTYNYAGIGANQMPMVIDPVNSIVSTNGCPGKMANCQIPASFYNTPLTALRTIHQSAKQQLLTTEQRMNNLIDGGDKQALLNAINDPNTKDQQLKNTLKKIAPYLSDEVLLAVINRPGFNNAFLVPILINNSPLSDTVLTALQGRKPPVSGVFKNLLRKAQTGTSGIEELQIDYSNALTELTYAEDEVVRAFLNDTTIVNPMDSIINFLSTSELPEAQLTIAEACLKTHNISGARAAVDSFQIAPHSDEINSEVTDVAIDIADDGEYCASYSQAKETQLQNLAQTEIYGDVMAYALIEMNSGQHQYEIVEPFMPNSYKKAPKSKQNEHPFFSDVENVPMMSNYPNPFRNATTIVVELPNEYTGAKLEIRDVLGKLVQSRRLNEGSNIFWFEGKNIKPGTYMYSLISKEGRVVETQRMVLLDE